MRWAGREGAGTAGAAGDELDEEEAPEALIAAAAAHVLDEADQGHDVSLDAALLRFIGTRDMEETLMEEERTVRDLLHESSDLRPALRGLTREHKLSYHVYYEGRWWQWAALVRALDGYVTQVDRGRHARFWNGLAGWVQAEAARPEARRQAAAAERAAAAAEEAPEVEEEEESVGTVKRCDFVAVWILGETPEDPGQMEIGNVRAIYGRAAKKGFLQKDATDPASANGDVLKLELFDYDEESGELKPRAGGVRFLGVAAAQAHAVLAPARTSTAGVLCLPDDERRALSDAQVGLTATAVKVIREQVAARAARKDALAAEKRTAGTTDPSKLTAELLREELKLRRERRDDRRAAALEQARATRRPGACPRRGSRRAATRRRPRSSRGGWRWRGSHRTYGWRGEAGRAARRGRVGGRGWEHGLVPRHHRRPLADQ